MMIGIILAAVFAASTAYSGMKSGLTVAVGIPGAIIGSMLIGAFARSKGILGKNIIQGMSSGGESIASGMIYVLPAIILIGSSITFLEGVIVGIGGTLFGIGFIVGLEVSLTMFAGSILSNFGIDPLIGYFTDMAANNMSSWNDASVVLNQMDVNAISGSYVKYIGAGMVLCGGIIGALKLIPTIVVSIKETLKAKSGNDSNAEGNSGEMIILLSGVVIAFIAAFIVVAISVAGGYN